MIIHTFGGQANIMGKDTGFLYDGKLNELRIQGISFDEAQRLLAALESGTVLAASLQAANGAAGGNGGYAAIPAASGVAVVQAPTLASTSPAKGPLGVDPARMAAIAAGSPAKEPKPEKEPRAKREKQAKVEPEAEAKADASNEPEKTVPPPAESSTKVTENGKATNGAAKAATDLPQAIIDARKLRDVLTLLLEHDKIEFGSPGSDERNDAIMKLKKRCAEIKEEVPCLSRIAELSSRIDRTVEVMDMGDELS